MVTAPRSSFIPKETTAAIPMRVRRRRTFSVFNILATLLLMASVLLAGGTYFYKLTLEKKNETTIAQFNELQKSFNKTTLQEVRSFDRKLRAAAFLLDNHLAPSKVFASLEEDTMNRIQFSSFTYEYDPSLQVFVELQGGTEEFKTVALQSDAFADNPIWTDGLFTDLGTTDIEQADDKEEGETNGKVGFSVKSAIPLDPMKYDGRNAGGFNVDPPPVETAEITEPLPVGNEN